MTDEAYHAGCAVETCRWTQVKELTATVSTQRELIAALAGALGRLLDNYGDQDAERCPRPLDECSLCNAVEVLAKVRVTEPA